MQYRKVRSCGSSNWRLALSTLLVALFLQSPSAWANDSDTKAEQYALLGTHIGSTITGLALQTPFGIPAELGAYAADIGVKHIDSVLTLPPDKSFEPNTPNLCEYEFISSPTADRTGNTLTETTSRAYFINFNPLDSGAFGDLGRPSIAHPHAEVDVSVTHPSLSESYPRLESGYHTFAWESINRLNLVMDVTLPLLLIPAGAAAETYSTKEGASKTAKVLKSGDEFFVDFSQELALTAGLIALEDRVLSPQAWWDKTSVDLASTRRTGYQTLKVWDLDVPFIVDPNAGNAVIEGSQEIVIEATDFGGVRFENAEAILRGMFEGRDRCGKQVVASTQTNPRLLLPVTTDDANPIVSEVDWTLRETLNGPYQSGTAQGAFEMQSGEQIELAFTQRIRVEDTQAPILVPPPGTAVEAAAPIVLDEDAPFRFGRPQVVDLADPAPAVTQWGGTWPSQLQVDRRYANVWSASDVSGNVTTAPANNPDGLTQIISVKTPDTNTAPTAETSTAQTLTSEPVEIELFGNDADLLPLYSPGADGNPASDVLIANEVPDPLEFRISDQPDNGIFEAPLLPFFIEDYRLTPLGERQEGDNLSRTSPLGDLAAGLLDVVDQGRYMNEEICLSPDGTLGNVIPINFVYKPEYIHVDDDGFYYILDFVWICGEGRDTEKFPEFSQLAPKYRVSKWTSDGEYVDMLVLDATVSDEYPDDLAGYYSRPTGHFFVDQNDVLWIPMGWEGYSGVDAVARYIVVGSDLQDPYFVGTDPSTTLSWLIPGSTVDANNEVFYELRAHPLNAFTQIPEIRRDQIVMRPAEAVPFGITWQEDIDTWNEDTGNAISLLSEDIASDSEGALYIADSLNHRIHKIGAAVRNADGELRMGDYIGWMGRCSGNLLDPDGVPYNACDVDRGISRGFACTDTKCAVAQSSGSEIGQFNRPVNIAFNKRDIMYVADFGNSRVQRFSKEGVPAGVANSTGTGINTGEQPGFLLGNFGMPETLSVNNTSLFIMALNEEFDDFFVHAYKSLPFYDVTDNSAKVKYVSDFDFYNSIDTFAYYTHDGISRSAPATVSITVNRAFRAPEDLVAICYETTARVNEIPCVVDEDESLLVGLRGFDKDGFISTGGLDSLSFSITTATQNGTLEALDEFAQDNSVLYRYTPDEHFNGVDQFAFTADDGVDQSQENPSVVLTVNPVADDVEISIAANQVFARGFPSVIKVDFADPDKLEDEQPLLAAIGTDGYITNAPGFANSGAQDLNGRDISPQTDTLAGEGVLIFQHTYPSAGVFPLSVGMTNTPAASVTQAIETVTVVETTRLHAYRSGEGDLLADVQTPINLVVENQQPTGWAGMSAANVVVTITPADDLELTPVDPRCIAGDPIVCTLPDTLLPGMTTALGLNARVSVDAARRRTNFEMVVEISDDAPDVTQDLRSMIALSLMDSDADGVIDQFDAFPTDAAYTEDTDGDGLADVWEENFALDPLVADDPGSDLDGDGVSLINEFLNGTSPLLAQVSRLFASPVVIPPGVRQHDRFGLGLAGADLNDDGFADTLIGAPGYDGNGAVFVSYGSSDGAEAPQLLLTSPGEENFGVNLATADFDGNGFPDIAVGADDYVYIYFNNGRIYDQPDEELLVLSTVSLLHPRVITGDLDNDGEADLAVQTKLGATTTRLQLYRSSEGLFGASPSTYTISDTDLGDALLITDIDGDQLMDLVLGGGGSSSARGSVRGYLGAQNDWQASLVTAFNLFPEASISRFGFTLASADIGADGTQDLIVGGYAGRGSLSIYRSETGYWSSQPTADDVEIVYGLDTVGPGDSYAGQLGVGLAAGVLNRTSNPDVLGGENRAGDQDEGRVTRFTTSADGLVRGEEFLGLVPFDLLGYRVAIVGDIDGDGVDDAVSSAPDLQTGGAVNLGGHVQFYYHMDVSLDDVDGDGYGEQLDNCPATSNPTQRDLDSDGLGDSCDVDMDGDGVDNNVDNCPLINQSSQLDTDGDGMGNACDPDDDNDGVADGDDVFPLDPNESLDSDLDGIGNNSDDDDDNDGLADVDEAIFGTDPFRSDTDGDGVSDADEVSASTDPLDARDCPDSACARSTFLQTIIRTLQEDGG